MAGRLLVILGRVAADLPLSLPTSPTAAAATARRAHKEALNYCAAFVKFNSAALAEVRPAPLQQWDGSRGPGLGLGRPGQGRAGPGVDCRTCVEMEQRSRAPR